MPLNVWLLKKKIKLRLLPSYSIKKQIIVFKPCRNLSFVICRSCSVFSPSQLWPCRVHLWEWWIVQPSLMGKAAATVLFVCSQKGLELQHAAFMLDFMHRQHLGSLWISRLGGLFPGVFRFLDVHPGLGGMRQLRGILRHLQLCSIPDVSKALKEKPRWGLGRWLLGRGSRAGCCSNPPPPWRRHSCTCVFQHWAICRVAGAGPKGCAC